MDADNDRVTAVVVVVVVVYDDDYDEHGLIISKYTQYPHQTLQGRLSTSPSPHTPFQTLPAWVIQIKYQVFIRYVITYTNGLFYATLR